MRIDAFELRSLRMPLKAPFTTSFGTQTEREIVLVRALGPDAEGWGECVTMAAPLYSAEYTTGAREVMLRWLAPALLEAPALTAAIVGELLAPIVGHRMAKAALEMAVLDAELRAAGRSFASAIGATAAAVPSGVSVGIQPSIEELLRVVGGFIDEGYVRIKIKIKPGWDVEPVRAIRSAFGDELPLQVDANSAYTLAQAAVLRQLDDFGLLLIEQPLYEDDLRLHATLAGMLRTPVCLDESIVSARAAADAIALGAASVINVKPGRVGGYLEAVRIHDLARANGVAVWCGGMLETGVGRAANAALAALPGFTLPGDISASDRFYEEDLTEPILLEDGRIRVPDGAGFGRTPIPEILARYTVDTVTVRR
ncbi:MAG: o-succinylbenzoate synthase [Microbacteriaceae bacterium]